MSGQQAQGRTESGAPVGANESCTSSESLAVHGSADSTFVTKIDLGPERGFTELPAAIDIGERQYFLVRDGDEYRLLSRVCPHQGGIVMGADNCFECPQHGWRFDLKSGRGLGVSGAQLASLPITVRNGRLEAVIGGSAPARANSSRRQAEWPSDFAIRLIAHACLEIRQGGRSLLTDPWLSGPAFLGAWMAYPPPQVHVESLRPDAILISHEHSDHFHVPTLRRFARQTPIYAPDFPNGRILRTLAALGFSRVCPMRFGQPYDIAPGMRVTCFEPPGLWNDSILLIEVGGIRILDINDAGVNHRIASLVGPVDILAAAFNPASSYPFTWSHLSESAKEQISERARSGFLRMLHQAAKRYRAQYLLPFASHFALWHPSHRKYISQMRRNTLGDVVRAFRHTEVEVLDMLPGGTWEPRSGLLDRGPDRTELHSQDRLHMRLDEAFDQAVFEAHHPPRGALSRREIEAYFVRLNDVPDIAFCEDLVVRVEAADDGDVPIDVTFRIEAGQLSIIDSAGVTPDLTMQVPLRVLRHIVKEEASWDEAHVGFWCRFTRTPDAFHAGFWRLLQAPYFRRRAELDLITSTSQIGETSSMATLIERYGRSAERVLARYGLHCSACPHAPAESLTLAARRHGLDDTATERLVRELNVVLDGPPPHITRA